MELIVPFLIYTILYLYIYNLQLKKRVRAVIKDSNGVDPIDASYFLSNEEIIYQTDSLTIKQGWDKLEDIVYDGDESIDLYFKNKSLFSIPLKDMSLDHTKEEIVSFIEARKAEISSSSI